MRAPRRAAMTVHRPPLRLHTSFRSSHWPASTARTVIGSHYPASAGFEGIGRGWGEGDALWDRHSRLRPGPCRHWSSVLGFRGGNRCPVSRAGLRPRASRAFRFGRAGDAARAGWLQTLGIENLPCELQRNFQLMRELDQRTEDKKAEIDILAAEYISTVKTLSPDQRVERLQKIQNAYSKCKEYSDDKVQLAMQTYEMVDKHIRRLDADLARFEADLKDKMEGSDFESSGGRGLKKGRGQKEKRGSRGRGRRTSEEDTPKKKKHKGGFWLCRPGWSAIAQSRLTAASASRVQAILPPQPSK
ncbi:inhibitor of growth protein 5 isoform X2 [Macaca nemestrina]|uniref:inhibitor of growth protein 5 isoform X2 n=2 Tax=Macaca TaxID=9539 RepID=UPI0039B8EAA3